MVLPKFMPISCFEAYLVFEVFLKRESKEMLAVSYLVLQACILFLRRFGQEWQDPPKLWKSFSGSYFRKNFVAESRFQTFISCYRTPRPQKGFWRGFRRGLWRVFEGSYKGFIRGPWLTPSKTLQKPFKNPSETLRSPLQRPLLKPFRGRGVL